MNILIWISLIITIIIILFYLVCRTNTLSNKQCRKRFNTTALVFAFLENYDCKCGGAKTKKKPETKYSQNNTYIYKHIFFIIKTSSQLCYVLIFCYILKLKNKTEQKITHRDGTLFYYLVIQSGVSV